ncbi:acidic mammalian chitinase-like [Microplitis demolitor]|uniref:acidic mammalian chitinase-like n=1 Tax=Microplitis demolitor TaxID=69319 RepID=UPI0006D507CF|nr:acidic mammalian chitinase-like [Microplitis demolitor]
MRVFIAFATLCLATCAANKKIVCYFGSWSVYRPDNGKFDIGFIDPTLCTHLIYTFVGMQNADIQVLDPWQDLPDDYGKNGFGRFNALRKKSPSTKIMIAIGGWNEGSAKYSAMADDPELRERFADNVVAFVKKWGFDGFDLDWEYPNQRGGSAKDVKNFVELVKVLRQRFDKEGLILSAAVAAAESSASKSYDIAEMSKYLDFINLMAYDFHGAWEPTTGLNAPLHAAASDSYEARGLNSEAAVKYWLSKGAPKEKLILGVPTYGRAFTLTNPQSHGIGAASLGVGAAGPYTREAGMLGYNEICEMQKNGGWNVNYDEERQAPWAHKDRQWIGFDNIKSIKAKAEFAKQLGLGGAMVWSIETDDFRGICGEKYPLLKTLKAVLLNGEEVSQDQDTVDNNEVPNEVDEPNNSDDSTSTDNEPRPPPPTPSGNCQAEGPAAIPGSCGFVICSINEHGELKETPMNCHPSLCFNPKKLVCDWPENN